MRFTERLTPWMFPAAACAMVAWARAFWAAINESATWDETYAVAAGYSQIAAGDFRLAPENPPLLGWIVTPALKLLGSVPLDLPQAPIAPASVPNWGTHFFFDIGNRHELMLLLSRMSVMALTVLAMAMLVRLAHRLYGVRGAWLCALLCAFEPNWITHGHIAAWDGIGTAAMVLALVAFTGWLEAPRMSRALLAGAGLGLALSAKHTALALGPVCVVSVLLCSFRRPGGDGWVWPPDRVQARSAAFGAAVMLATALFVVGASYNLSFDFSRYLNSIGSIYRLNNSAFENYLWGSFSAEPFPLYYVAALLVKTPSVSLPLLLLGLAALLRARPLGIVPAALLCVVMLVATAFNRYQIGIRHVLPAVPCLILLASAASTLHVRGRSMAPLAIALAGLGAVESLSQGPHSLAFFNWVSGGPAKALRYLDDSNVDWGQDLVALASLQRSRQLGSVRLLYNGTARPSAYGVDSIPIDARELTAPEPGVLYAISLNHLHRIRRVWGDRVGWLARAPRRMAGRSIAIYRGPSPALPQRQVDGTTRLLK